MLLYSLFNINLSIIILQFRVYLVIQQIFNEIIISIELLTMTTIRIYQRKQLRYFHKYFIGYIFKISIYIFYSIIIIIMISQIIKFILNLVSRRNITYITKTTILILIFSISIVILGITIFQFIPQVILTKIRSLRLYRILVGNIRLTYQLPIRKIGPVYGSS